MTFEECRELLIQALTEIQTGSGRPFPEIHGDLCPIGDFEGFDSLNAVEVASLLTEHLNCEIRSDFMLPTYPGRHLTINEIAGRLQQAIGAQEG